MRARSARDTLGARVAGGLLILGAMGLAYLFFLGRATGPVVRFTVAVDLILGVALVTGHGVSALSIGRCFLGAVVLTQLELTDGRLQVINDDWLAAAAEFGFCAGILALLLGDPSPARVVAGTLAATPQLVLLFSWRGPRITYGVF